MTETGAGAPQHGIVLEVAALVLLTVGSLVSWVGWVGGVLLLWTSRRWDRRDKVLGSLVLPGGLAAAWWFARGPATVTCTQLVTGPEPPSVSFGPPGAGCSSLPFPLPVMIAVQLVLLLAPLGAAAWLGWRLRRTG